MNTEPFLSSEEIDLLKRTLLRQFPEDQQEIFIRICQRSRLDPMTRQIYATKRMSRGNVTLVPVTGIQGLAAIAERTGQYDGAQTWWCGPDGQWKEEWLEEQYPSAAKCIVHHKAHSYPEVGIARWESYVGRSYNSETKRWEVSDFWHKMPDLMLAKVAKALALRGAFPDHLSGLYAAEEMDQARGESDEMDDERKVAQNRKREEELLKKAKAEGVRVVESKPAPRPSPAEAAAPAFPETVPVPIQTLAPQQEPDDLDMEPSQPPQPEPSAEAEAGSPAWKEHVISGLRNDKVLGRKVGDLSPVELASIEASGWIAKVRAVWDTVKKAQKEDAAALEAAIAHSKLEKPW